MVMLGYACVIFFWVQPKYQAFQGDKTVGFAFSDPDTEVYTLLTIHAACVAPRVEMYNQFQTARVSLNNILSPAA